MPGITGAKNGPASTIRRAPLAAAVRRLNLHSREFSDAALATFDGDGNVNVSPAAYRRLTA